MGNFSRGWDRAKKIYEWPVILSILILLNLSLNYALQNLLKMRCLRFCFKVLCAGSICL